LTCKFWRRRRCQTVLRNKAQKTAHPWADTLQGIGFGEYYLQVLIYLKGENCVVEKAKYEDLEEILALQKLAYQSEAELCNDFNIPPLTQTLEGIKEDYKNQTILEVKLDGKIIGSIRAFKKEDVCYIGRVIVHPEHQNKGMGKVLMKNIEELFSECSKYSLFDKS
jgi:N-acetylglutamate synthase-like GNAT family acetyltransferase